jgi:hypothetical protein
MTRKLLTNTKQGQGKSLATMLHQGKFFRQRSSHPIRQLVDEQQDPRMKVLKQ